MPSGAPSEVTPFKPCPRSSPVSANHMHSSHTVPSTLVTSIIAVVNPAGCTSTSRTVVPDSMSASASVATVGATWVDATTVGATRTPESGAATSESLEHPALMKAAAVSAANA